uniref:Uncharacterized protein n=1 Tax=Romanomermis culicivorax TaxID=13658 RepID=A0A915KBX5_ROMCU
METEEKTLWKRKDEIVAAVSEEMSYIQFLSACKLKNDKNKLAREARIWIKLPIVAPTNGSAACLFKSPFFINGRIACLL